MSFPRLARPCTLSPILHPRAHPRTATPTCLFHRNASTKSPETSNLRPLVLEQPDKFRPPSHGARKPRKPRNFGPALTEEEIREQSTRRYPHSMPPEGTVMYKFLTNKAIHVWISMGVLTSMAGFILLTDFKMKNKFPELLPPGSLFFSNPISYAQQIMSVYKLHSDAYFAEQEEKRARNIDEVRKRKEYLIAHGIDKEGIFGFGTVEGKARKEKRAKEQDEYTEIERRGEQKQGAITLASSLHASQGNEDVTEDSGKETGKKWLGIW